MGKQGGKTVNTSAVDPATAAYAQRVNRMAQDAAGNYSTVGPSDASTLAANTYGQFANAGINGLAALQGDAGALAGFMNPYQKNVIDASNAQFGQDLATLNNNADSAATAAGAFGGSRSAVVKGAAQGQLAQAHNSQIAGLLSEGFGNAMNRANTVANLGFMGAQGAQDIGAYLREIQQRQANPDAERLRLLQAGVTAPTSQTTTEQQPGTNWLQTAGSIAGIGTGLFGSGGLFGGKK